MPKQSKIRYKKSDLEEMRRIVRNFNRRRAYQIKHHPETAHLQPEKMTVEKVKENIATRDDFNRWKKSAKGYTAETAKVKSNKYGVQATIYEVKETEKAVRRVNAKRAAAEKKRRQVYINGKKVNTAEKVSTGNEYKKTKRNFDKAKTSKEWDEFQKSFRRKATDKASEQAKALYWENLKDAFDKRIGNDELWLMYETLGINIIVDLYENGLQCVDLDFIYDTAIDSEEKENTIWEELPEQIKIHGLVSVHVKKLREYFNVDSNADLKQAWDSLTEEQIFELYKDGFQVNNPDEMLKQVNRFKDEKKKQQRKKKK